MRTTTTIPTTLKVLMNHIYELHKGVRHMVLFTRDPGNFAYLWVIFWKSRVLWCRCGRRHASCPYPPPRLWP